MMGYRYSEWHDGSVEEQLPRVEGARRGVQFT